MAAGGWQQAAEKGQVTRGSLLSQPIRDVDQVLIRLGESGGVGVVHRVGGELFDQREAVHHDRQLAGLDVGRVLEALRVEVFDQVRSLVGGQGGVVNGRHPDLLGDWVGADAVQRGAGDVV